MATENMTERMQAMADERRQWRESWEKRLEWTRADLAAAEERLRLERTNVTALKRMIRSLEKVLAGEVDEDDEE